MEKLTLALEEFIHVGGALLMVIAAVSVLTGFMREYIPQDKLQNTLSKHEKKGPLLGALFGMLTPFCSASVVPITMGMATMGASLGTLLSFLISAPLCNFVVLALIYATFGFKITAIYLAITLSAAMFGGWIITKTPWRDEIKRGDELEIDKVPSCSATPENPCAPVIPCTGHAACVETSGVSQKDAANQTNKTKNALRFALALFKKIMPYVLLGALISGLSAAYVPSEMVEKYVGDDSLIAILIAAIIGVPLYLRIEVAIPLLDVLISKGMGIGPAMALIIGGTGASLPEIALVSAVLKPKGIVAFVTIVLITAIIGGLIFQFIV